MKKRDLHWHARAGDYRQLAQEARDSDVRQVFDHLARVCTDMANATEASGAARTAPTWVYPSDIPREASAQRWRIREAEYHAMADNSRSPEGIQGWRTLAGRCAELAAYLEATASRRAS